MFDFGTSLMPTLAESRAKNAQRIAAGGQTGTGVGPQPPNAPLVVAPSPQLDLPIGSGLPQRGTFPAEIVLGGDINDSNRTYRGQGMRSTTFPSATPQSTVTKTTVTEAVAAASVSAATLAIQIEGSPVPDQKVLNFIPVNGLTITFDQLGGVYFNVASTGGNAFQLIDQFHGAIASGNISGTTPGFGIGELGWTLLGNTGGQGGNIGGTFPNFGQFGWTNSGTASQAGWLTWAGSGDFSSSEYSQLSFGLADTPGSILTYIFKLESPSLSPVAAFNMAQTALYVGLTGPNINPYSSSISRPNFFIGVRYDTSTTAPSIDDSFFTLEVVSNPVIALDTYARNNTQGTTLVTSIAPTQGVWHTLILDFTVMGSVTLTLDGSVSLTATIPPLTVFGNISATVENGAALLGWNIGASTPQSFWNAGTSLTVSGFTSTLSALNGVWTLTAAVEQDVGFDLPGTLSGSETATLKGYPSMVPLFMMGNDDTATPTFNSRMIVVDYFELIWNSQA
jgi:hypothetical protein